MSDDTTETAKLHWQAGDRARLKLKKANDIALNAAYDVGPLPDDLTLLDDDGDPITNASFVDIQQHFSIEFNGNRYHFNEPIQDRPKKEPAVASPIAVAGPSAAGAAPSTPDTTIGLNTLIKYYNDPAKQFPMDRSVNVQLSEIFSKKHDGTFTFNQENGILDLACLSGLHTPGPNEEFLPDQFFVRPYLQVALKYRLANDDARTVVYGSPGVGKSVFSFLAAIAVASTENYGAVLYVRKISEIWTVTNVSIACSHMYFKDTPGAINKTNSPTFNGIKIIVDGPRYNEDTGPKHSDLITSGGCPVQKQESMESEWQFPLNAWSFQEMAPALKALKNCNRNVAKRVYETTGGSIRLALKCLEYDGTANLYETREWIEDIAKKHASKPVIEMAYYATELSADPNSLDRLRSLIAKEREASKGRSTGQSFEKCMLLASPFVARLLQSQLTMGSMLEALNFVKNSGIGSLYEWHFELWAHKISEIAIDRWQKEAQKAIEEGRRDSGGTIVDHIEGEGTGKESVKYLKAVWLYWKPSISNFGSIDAAILEDGTLLCLQFTVDTVHGFNFKTFNSNFLDQIPEGTRSDITQIIVMFVIPSEKEVFASVRVPYAQAHICLSVVAEMEGSPKVQFVQHKDSVRTVVDVPMEPESQGTEEEDGNVSGEDNNSMDTGNTFSHVTTDYHEELDYEFFFDEEGTSNLDLRPEEWAMQGVKIVFQWMTVDAASTKEGDSPFFTLPDI